MTENHTRSFAADFEIREEGDGHTITGIVVPYDETIDASDDGLTLYRERFIRGAFKDSVARRGGRLSLFMMHDDIDPSTGAETRATPIGKFSNWNDSAEGLVGTARVASSIKGEEALALVRDGVFDAFSVNFAALPKGTREVNGVRERVKAFLKNVSLVDQPAYSNAKVLSLRDDIEVPKLATPRLNSLRTYLDTL